MKDKLPQPILHRPKVGFDIPAHDWLRGPLRTLLVETLRAGAAEYRKSFVRQVLEAHLHDHLERRVNIGYHLWGLMILFLWMKKWNVRPPRPATRASWLHYRSWSVYLALLLIAGVGILQRDHLSSIAARRCGFSPGADRPHHADLGRLGDGAAGWRCVPREAAAGLLDDGLLL